MSKVSSYIRSLVPRLEKDHVLKELDRARKDVVQNAIPYYEKVNDLFDKWDFKHDFMSALDKEFKRRVDTPYRGNYIQVNYRILKNLEKHITNLEEILDKTKSKDFVSNSLTYTKANILRLTELVHFFTTYSRSLLSYTLAVETDAFTGHYEQGLEFTKAEVDYLKENKEAYYKAASILSKDAKDINSTIQEIPDAIVDEETEDDMAANAGRQNLDPLGLMGSRNSINPIYHFRIKWEDWMRNHTEFLREETKQVELQIMKLEAEINESPDPKIEKALEYQRDRVIKLKRKIAKHEEKGR